MNLKGFLKYSVVLGALLLPSVSCQKFLDINDDPNAVKEAPIEQIFTAATTSLGFFAGSDLNRYSSLLTQQLSGQGPGAITQTQEYERYNIAGSDVNNSWNLAYSTILSDLELIVQKAAKENCSHYGGCAKIMKAYTFSLLADAWGMIPFTEALKFKGNLNPKFDDASTIYPALIAMLDEGIVDIKNANSLKSPGTNSTIFAGPWATGQQRRWENLANTLKMRLWLHTVKVDKTKALAAINTLSTSNLMTSIADNFQMPFLSVTRQQNPIHQFELDRANYLFSNAAMVDMMNTKVDPRRARYFVSYPIHSGLYKGAKGGDASSTQYSRMHIYLRGDTTSVAAISGMAGNYTYTGAAPIRMLTYAELQFIQAEAAVLNGGMLGTVSAETFFQNGIRASMSQAGVAAATAEAYINATTGGALNGALTGTETDKIKKIIEEKFVANFGVVMEPWSDWRRTGFPTITAPVNALVPTTPRSFFYPQSEIDLNPNAPKQKADMSVRVFWDK